MFLPKTLTEYIPNYKKNDSEINNSQKLIDENINLKNINTLTSPSADKFLLEKENKNLKDKLVQTDKIIENKTKVIQDLNNQINFLKNLNNNNELKKQIQNINLNKNKINTQINQKDMKCVTFITTVQSIFFGIPCNGNSTFAEVEEKLYKEWHECRETNNLFYANGKEILRFKTINDNLIGTGKSVMLVKPS